MERQAVTTWRNFLGVEWLNLGLELLAQKGVEESNYCNEVVKDRLLQSVALTYWEALTGHAKCLGLEIEDIGKRLGLNRSTYNRWIKAETSPHPDKFFGTLVVVLKKEIQEVGFPRNREVVWSAVARTIGLIREKECERDGRRPTREEFVCVRWLLGHPQADGLLPGQPRRDPKVVDDVFVTVERELRGQFPGVRGINNAFVRHVLIDWARPYVLFRIGLLNGWEFIDEDAV